MLTWFLGTQFKEEHKPVFRLCVGREWGTSILAFYFLYMFMHTYLCISCCLLHFLLHKHALWWKQDSIPNLFMAESLVFNNCMCLETVLIGFVTSYQEKQKAKVREKLDKCVKEKLMDFCDVLNIPINRSVVKKVGITYFRSYVFMWFKFT